MSTDEEKKAAKERERAELKRKLESAERELAIQLEMLESRIRHGQETSSKEIDVKFAAEAVKRLKNELDRL